METPVVAPAPSPLPSGLAVPPPPPPPALPRPVAKEVREEAMAMKAPLGPDPRLDADLERERTALAAEVTKAASLGPLDIPAATIVETASPASPPPRPRAIDRAPLTDLARALIAGAEWKYRAMKAARSLADMALTRAAQNEDAAYAALMDAYEAAGIDTSRAFEIDPQGRVTYPIKGPNDYAPRSGATVKR